MPDNVEPVVADNFAQEDGNLGRPDFDSSDYSGLAHRVGKSNMY